MATKNVVLPAFCRLGRIWGFLGGFNLPRKPRQWPSPSVKTAVLAKLSALPLTYLGDHSGGVFAYAKTPKFAFGEFYGFGNESEIRNNFGPSARNQACFRDFGAPGEYPPCIRWVLGISGEPPEIPTACGISCIFAYAKMQATRAFLALFYFCGAVGWLSPQTFGLGPRACAPCEKVEFHFVKFDLSLHLKVNFRRIFKF